MSRERELLERALSFFEEICDSRSVGIEKSINAYLAKPEQDEEPVAYIQRDQLEKAARSPMLCAVSPEPRQDRVGIFLHPAPRPEPTQDEEPVAWTNQDELNDLGPYINCYMYLAPEAGDIPLYLHPAPRKPFVRLSEEEVSEILCSAHTAYEAICAVENRLVEKNK